MVQVNQCITKIKLNKMIESLENKKAALELLQNETNEKLQDYRQQVSIIQKQIDDYNKPELTPAQLDSIT